MVIVVQRRPAQIGGTIEFYPHIPETLLGFFFHSPKFLSPGQYKVDEHIFRGSKITTIFAKQSLLPFRLDEILVLIPVIKLIFT